MVVFSACSIADVITRMSQYLVVAHMSVHLNSLYINNIQGNIMNDIRFQGDLYIIFTRILLMYMIENDQKRS